MAKHVLLIGMMGVGKTTVGRILARRLGRPFLDTDREIAQRCGTSIADIFAVQGEGFFRQQETALLAELKRLPSSTVIACGGGIVLREENRQQLKELGWAVWLRISTAELVYRLQHTQLQQRPLLATPDWLRTVNEMQCQRQSLYRAAADWVVDVDHKSPEQVAREVGRVVRLLEGRR